MDLFATTMSYNPGTIPNGGIGKSGRGFYILDVRATLIAEAGSSGGGEGEREGVVCSVIGSEEERAEVRRVWIGAPNILLGVGPGVTVGVSGFGGSAAIARRVKVGKALCGVGWRKAGEHEKGV